MAMSAPKLVEAIAACGPAMAALDAFPIEDHRPPKVHTEGPLLGTLVMRDDGTPEDPGDRGRTLGDMVREYMEGRRG